MSSKNNDLNVSDNVRQIQPSATIAVSTLAKKLKAEGRDIINLGAGEPDFDTPAFIRQAAIDAIQGGATRYTPAAGLPELRQAVARELARGPNPELDPDGVVVSAGAKHSLFNAIFSVVGPGEEMLVPAPYWTTYPELVRLARAEPRVVVGPEDRDYRVDVDTLDAAYDDTVRAILLNTPSNPSGAVYTLEEVEAIVAWAADRHVWVITDEIYNRLWHDGPEGGRAPGLLDLDPALLDRAVVVDGVSKTYAMTGWRIGYSWSRTDLAKKMGALQSHMTSNAATPSQHAAMAALGANEEQRSEVLAMAREFRARRDLVVELLGEVMPDVGCVRPAGAFYLFFRVDAFFTEAVPDSVALCQNLIEEAGVALVPGSAFGDDRYVRMSFAASRDDLENGLRRAAAHLTR